MQSVMNPEGAASADQPGTAMPQRSARVIPQEEEKEIAQSLAPAVAWPTLALALVLPTTLIAFIALGLMHALPLWVCTPILAFVSYAHYTLVHESIHANVVAAPRSLNWVNTVVGWIGALGMGAGWPALQRTHLGHHAYTNTERDPDILVKGTLGQLLMKWLVMAPIALLPIFAIRFINRARYDRLREILSPSEVAQVSAVTLGTLALLAASIATGHVAEWLMLWFLPTRIGVLFLNVFFQWLPHHPFDRSERYLNTRISLWPCGTFLLLQQNLHLMHHLWPRVPFYNYARLFRALRPVLAEEGARIEGLVVGSPPRT